MKKITILVVDDNAIMRMGMVTALNFEADMKVVAEASTGRQALELYQLHTPDLVLMDLRLPDMSGDVVTGHLCGNHSNVRVLAFTSYDTQEDIFRCVQAGARSFLPKESPLVELLAAIRSVYAGQNYLPATIATRLMERMRSPELSARERSVLELLVKGRTNKEIARALAIAETTARDHVSSIFTKLQATDRTQASTIAIQRGLVRLE